VAVGLLVGIFALIPGVHWLGGADVRAGGGNIRWRAP
jgi:hypothetical protein